ncbi:acyl-CoA dehydrogenase [Sphingobium sp. BS19]|nr:acyl-CoA dehydrogenase [Sphingobium sp. BS19]
MFHSVKGDSEVLEKIEEILPEISAAAEEIESSRSVPARIIDKMRDAGLFRMMLPETVGGKGLDLLQISRVVEALARADGSTGWTAMVAAGYNALLPIFSENIIRKVAGDEGDVMVRGALAPKGRIVEVEGGYRISGQWPFGTGSFDNKWVMASGIVFDGERPRMGPNGIPEIRVVLVPKDQAKFLDTWHSVGMRGTSSHDFVIDDVFVPADHAVSLFGRNNLDSPIYNLTFRILTATQHTAVSLGIAYGAMDDLAQLAQTKRPAFRPNMRLIEDPVFTGRYGAMMAKLDAARATADWFALEAMELARSGIQPTQADEARHGSMVAYVSRICTEIADEVFDLAGSSACYNGNSIQRRWRDARVAAAHAAAGTDNYQLLAGSKLVDMQSVADGRAAAA